MIYYVDKHDDVRLVWISISPPITHGITTVRLVRLKQQIKRLKIKNLVCLTFEDFEKLL